MKTIFGAVLIVANVASAWAAGGVTASPTITISTNTAGDLAETCGAKQQAKQMFCQGFAQGAISMKLRDDGAPKPFCFPKPTPTRAATMQEFVKWVHASMERRVMPSTDALFKFLGEKYVCK